MSFRHQEEKEKRSAFRIKQCFPTVYCLKLNKFYIPWETKWSALTVTVFKKYITICSTFIATGNPRPSRTYLLSFPTFHFLLFVHLRKGYYERLEMSVLESWVSLTKCKLKSVGSPLIANTSGSVRNGDRWLMPFHEARKKDIESEWGLFAGCSVLS